MSTQFMKAFSATPPRMIMVGTQGLPIDSANWRSARYTRTGRRERPMRKKNGFTAESPSGGWWNHSRRLPSRNTIAIPAIPARNASSMPCLRYSPASSCLPAPRERDANTATGVRSPTPMMKNTLKIPTPNDEAARGTVPVRPIMTLSVTPISIWLSCPIVIGTARSSVARNSRSTAFIRKCYCGRRGVVQRYLR